MVTLPELPPLRDVIARHDLAAKRGFGQHFLLDLNLTAKIARAAGDLARGTTVEIGPGPGGLTRALLDAGARVFAIELDRRCLPALAEIAAAYPGRLTVLEGDALTLDPAAECRARGLPAPYRIVANLPYNVATPLLMGWLADIARYESLTLMFQKEVADRLAAKPRTKAYGRLAVAAQWRCTVERLFTLPPGAFVPPPKVESTVVRLVPRRAPLAPADPVLLERVTAAAFGQRRKMLRSSLKALGVPVEPLATAAGIDLTRRAETLDIAQFCALSRALIAAERTGQLASGAA
ncbi:MAG TPA: 16S rRNA (adenine(1518)-N(6)/adenine(1519)-N(6))-dimethyltransferase RsmA [Alphaproteobacteria bacterium]